MSHLITIAAAVLVLALVSAAIWPWTSCGACGGSGKGPGSTNRAWNYCRPCGGSGRRLRFLARIIRRDLARK